MSKYIETKVFAYQKPSGETVYVNLLKLKEIITLLKLEVFLTEVKKELVHNLRNKNSLDKNKLRKMFFLSTKEFENLPPVIVAMCDKNVWGKDFLLIDGAHRYAAHYSRGIKEIKCVVVEESYWIKAVVQYKHLTEEDFKNLPVK